MPDAAHPNRLGATSLLTRSGRRTILANVSTIRGELVGGATAALLSMPVSMGYGVLALHALGDQYVSHAILAGLYAATLVPLAALALGYRGTSIYAPRSMLALLLGSVVLRPPAGERHR